MKPNLPRDTVLPDPSMIGGVAKVPLARLPDPEAVFATRADRFAFLAEHSANLAGYLRFLSAVSQAQADLVRRLPKPRPLSQQHLAQARANRMPPIDRNDLLRDLPQIIDLLCDALAQADMPDAARQALTALREASPADRDWVMRNVAMEAIPADSVAVHLFASAAMQVHAAMVAEMLHVEQLVAIRIGICPACGGRPVASLVTENIGAEGARYCACATCQTLWNEVRVKCTCCGSTKGITYRSVETDQATVKAEVCRECGHWVKIMYQNKNPTIEVVADDVASLGLDLMMRDTDWQRGGFNPFLMGY